MVAKKAVPIIMPSAPIPRAPRKPLASAFIHSVAPLELDKPVVEVTFNNNPINIQGSLSLGSIVDSGIVYIMITGEPGENSMMVLRAPIDEDHRFYIKGVPAGRIRLAYSARIDHNNKRNEGWITTEPGNTYSVAFTENGLQLID